MEESEAIKELHGIRPRGGIIPQKRAEALDVAIQALEEVQQYRTIGTPEECRSAVEKQTAISREIIEGKYFCPKCHNLAPYPMYCGCGQKLY
nr:MAG TPA: putative cytoplasmic protein [Caudoviricetes sp.]